MALQDLQSIPLKADPSKYTPEEVQTVTDLLNSGTVNVGEVAQYFNVPKSVVISNLAGIEPKSEYTEQEVRKVEKLINLGVASTGDIAAHFDVAPSVVEQNLAADFSYNQAQIAEAQAGMPVSKVPDIPVNDIPADGSYTTQEVDSVANAISSGAMTEADVAKQFGVTEQQVKDEMGRRAEVAAGQVPTIADPYAGQALPDMTTALGGTVQQAPVQPVTQPAAQPAALPAAQPAATQPMGGFQAQLPAFATTNYNTGAEIPTGLRGSEMARKAGAQGAIGMLNQLNVASRQDVNPYAQAGLNALQQQQALSGALGQAEFDAAYQASPQMQFLREQGEQAALRTAAARGGAGGGNVMKELARFNTGLASGDLQNQIANLNALTGRGLTAAQQQGSYNMQTGLPAAQAISNLGQNLALGRTRVGEQLANQYGSAATDLGNIYASQGQNVANMIGGQTGNIVNQVNQAAINEANAQQGFGTAMQTGAQNMGGALAGLAPVPINVPNYGAVVSNALSAYGTAQNMGQQQPQAQRMDLTSMLPPTPLNTQQNFYNFDPRTNQQFNPYTNVVG
ncbi:hypothetical protein N8205_02005 [Flavobacteriaceae bacterium]|nr:hypothetical protein [Flavobacteriaceae bacterium]